MLIMFYGISGAGKTLALELLKEFSSREIHIGRKYSTRSRRKNDPTDMRVGFKDLTSTPCDIVYRLYGYEYGLDSSEINNHISKGSDYAVVVQDIETIRLLKKQFENSIAVFVHRELSSELYSEIGSERKVADKDVETRFSKRRQILEEYLASQRLFEHTILNIGNIEHLKDSIQCLISKIQYN